jgi:hypothetical protein
MLASRGLDHVRPPSSDHEAMTFGSRPLTCHETHTRLNIQFKPGHERTPAVVAQLTCRRLTH